MTNLTKLATVTAVGALLALPAAAQNYPNGSQYNGPNYNSGGNSAERGDFNRPPGVVGYGMYSHEGPEPCTGFEPGTCSNDGQYGQNRQYGGNQFGRDQGWQGQNGQFNQGSNQQRQYGSWEEQPSSEYPRIGNWQEQPSSEYPRAWNWRNDQYSQGGNWQGQGQNFQRQAGSGQFGQSGWQSQNGQLGQNGQFGNGNWQGQNTRFHESANGNYGQSQVPNWQNQYGTNWQGQSDQGMRPMAGNNPEYGATGMQPPWPGNSRSAGRNRANQTYTPAMNDWNATMREEQQAESQRGTAWDQQHGGQWTEYTGGPNQPQSARVRPDEQE